VCVRERKGEGKGTLREQERQGMRILVKIKQDKNKYSDVS
jgi:hypothetical protein